ncbi:uncharacterized protein SPAPADRAFT_64490 [Spathaspora passalidarum NRRL Y-27907]|uniref:Uncharacterized protein n=1 Tax=Spathaspora passalidarum (strain NRRL Y-27907 / 11-Y1) TaxID=619300 RepID=G3AGL5_SPAPN|nr:uncharacterized protein SPAPADRAFT_64490 [Spathaspora passalidarum NRRL Y-27907]EGW35354.1 hypothetical protein SPAPADRAFT_64490 [Spathaspora passalidarum NRRL Y-27907]
MSLTTTATKVHQPRSQPRMQPVLPAQDTPQTQLQNQNHTQTKLETTKPPSPQHIESTPATTTSTTTTTSSLPSSQQSSPITSGRIRQLVQPPDDYIKPYSHDKLYKTFTYTIILLPTLTSILFPTTTTTNTTTNEQIGNFIIDLLTVLLISWVVRYAVEWPFNWLKTLRKTKRALVQELLDSSEDQDMTKQILLIRKINTFEMIALVSCLLSSMFGSILLIWTRNYTIIDKVRKKMVFNNVNIALLQFWSIFRIFLTFTDILQNSSLNEGDLYIQQHHPRQSRKWYLELKDYFLPNPTNQILAENIQLYNKEFDQLKADLSNLQQIIKKFPSDSFTPFPLSINSGSVGSSPLSSASSSPIVGPASPVMQSKQPTMPKRVSTKQQLQQQLVPKKANRHFVATAVAKMQPPLKTIVEEDPGGAHEGNLSKKGLAIKISPPKSEPKKYINNSVRLDGKLKVLHEISLFDLLIHPGRVYRLIMDEIIYPYVTYQLQSKSYLLVKMVIWEVVNKYVLSGIFAWFLELYYNPFRYIKEVMVWICFKMPVRATITTLKTTVFVPQMILRWVLLKPLYLGMVIVFGTTSVFFSSIRSSKKKKERNVEPVKVIRRRRVPVNNSPVAVTPPFTGTEFPGMKQFHLNSPEERNFNGVSKIASILNRPQVQKRSGSPSIKPALCPPLVATMTSNAPMPATSSSFRRFNVSPVSLYDN